VGCENAQIAKTLVFVADGDPVMVVASGAHRVDLDLLCEVFDAAQIRQANPEEVRAATGYSVGGVSPLGCHLPIAFDETLLEYDCIYAAGGDGNTLFQVCPRTLADSLRAKVVRVAASPSPAA
jgi:prolyl-tRNA editing enzyme YbaK/EbsC (Cys-tRNA(Pro) deacylase)